MADRPTCTWIGASGQKYGYVVFERHPVLNPNQDGNYIYAKQNPQGQWVPVYIGQGDLAVRATTDHHRIACIDQKGATHIHMHLNPDKEARLAEERDLLGNYKQAYVPTGCNVREGG